MANKIWSGSINFGLVTIPVGLYSATENHTIQFNQYQRGTTDRVRYRRVNERTGAELNYSDIVKGREVNGTLVTVDPEELQEIAPGRSQTIDITSFVDLSEIDPVYFQKTYWLAPSNQQHSRPYDLLRRAMAETNMAGVATFVLRGKEYLTALRADNEALALDTLFFADEVRSPGEIAGDLGQSRAPSEQEMRMATDLIESMSGEWSPEEYEDTYAARVEKLIEDKSQGRTPEPAQPPPEATDVIDLTEALRRSADQARQAKGKGRSGSRQPAAAEAEAEPAASSGGTGGRARGTRLSELTKNELDKQARELNIRGRSKLSRDELEQAIAEASGSGSRKGRRAKAS